MDEPVKYEDHDIVWVKLGNCWWPGEVCSESRLPDGILKAVRKRPLVIVQFFDEEKYEYVKNINNICKYNDPRKNEFIQKGLDLLRGNKKYMEKFPVDVSRAERLTDGDVNIVNREQFSLVKKNVSSNMFSDDSPKQRGKGSKQSPGRSGIRKTKVISPQPIFHTPPMGKATAIFTTIAPLPPRVPNTTPDQYSCKICPFTTSRCNIMIMHMKTHTKTSKETSPQAQSPSNIFSTSSPKIIANENEKSTSFKLPPPQSLNLNDAHHANHPSIYVEPAEEPYKITRMEPPKKRKLPKKPGLKHIILADWSEDDDDDDDAKDSDKSRKDSSNFTKSNTSSLTENRSPNYSNKSFNLSIDSVDDSRKEQENSPSSEKASIVPKYRNIPKKDRRDIILSEFNSSSAPPNEDDNLSPGINLEKDDVNENRLDNVSQIDVKGQENVSRKLSQDISTLSDTVDPVVSPEVDSPKEKAETVSTPKEITTKESKISKPLTEKQKEVKKLSCFDFKDDEEDDTEDFLSSLSKLKQKYMSPDKHKSIEADAIPVEEEEEKKVEEQRDAQLVADIENLLNVTKMPEFAKVEPESVPSDVRGLPPKERGKRIFKSRNRTKVVEKVETETKTSQIISPEIFQRQTSANDSSGDSRLESDTSGNNLDESPIEINNPDQNNANSDKNIPAESINDSIMNPAPDEASKIQAEEVAEKMLVDSFPLENISYTPVESLPSNINETQITEHSETVQLDTTIEDDQLGEQTIHESIINENEMVSLIENPENQSSAVIEQTSNEVCLDDNDSIDSTIVEASDGNSNIMMSESEHDLNVLAAAETLLSMPNKGCTENKTLDYHAVENLNEIALNTMPGSPEILPDYDQELSRIEDEEIPSAQVHSEEMKAAPENLDDNLKTAPVDETPTSEEIPKTKPIEEKPENPIEEKTEKPTELEPIVTKSKSQIGRKTAAKRQKRKPCISESASVDVSNEDHSHKQKATEEQIIEKEQNNENEVIGNRKSPRTTRNQSKKLIEIQDQDTVPVKEQSFYLGDAPQNTSNEIEPSNLQAQSEVVVNSESVDTSIDNKDTGSSVLLTETKRRGKGRRSKDNKSEVLIDNPLALQDNIQISIGEEVKKRSNRRTQKMIVEKNIMNETRKDLEDKSEAQIETKSHSKQNQDHMDTNQTHQEIIESSTSAYVPANEELQTQEDLSECQNEDGKRMDLDFEKLDLAELQSQTEQQHVIRSEISEEYLPVTSDHAIVSTEVENFTEDVNKNEESIVLNEDTNQNLETSMQVEKLASEPLQSESNSLAIDESEEFDKDRKSKRKRTRKKDINEELEYENAKEFAFDTKSEAIALGTPAETESTDHLIDSEDNRLVIDTDALQRYDVSEEAEEIIHFDQFVKHNEEAHHEVDNHTATGEEICDIFSDERPGNEDDMEKNENIENIRIQTPDTNAAEQILDEISNLTSSIDIILDSERTNDDSEENVDESKDVPQPENITEKNSIEIDENIHTESFSYTINNEEAQNLNEEVTNLKEDDVKQLEKCCESNITLESENVPSDISSVSVVTSSPEIHIALNTPSRKRNSHLKYTPPKSNAKNSSSDTVSPEYEEIIQDSQIAVEEPNQTVVSIIGSSVHDTVLDTTGFGAEGETRDAKNESKDSPEKSETVEAIARSRPPDGIFEPSQEIDDYIESTLNFNQKSSMEPKTDVAPKVSSTPMLINMFQFDHDPIIPSTERKFQISRHNKDANKEKHQGGTNIESSTKKPSSAAMYLMGNESKVSSKRRLSKLKDPTSKGPAVTISEEIQERFKVYSFDDQADTFDVPKKSKYSNSKENKNDRFSTKAESKHASTEGPKSHTSSIDRPKHSRSRQLNLQNVSDVCIPKFPKIDRTKRPTIEPNDHAKNEYDIVDTNQKFGNGSDKKNTSNLQTTPTTNRFSHQDTHLNFNTLEMEGIIPMGSTSTSGQDFVSASSYGEIQLSTTALTSFTSTPAITSKKKSRATTSSSRKSKQQQQLAMQQSIVSPSIYDPYAVQQSFDVVTPQTKGSNKCTKVSTKDKNSRKQSSLNVDDTQSFGLNQLGDQRGHVISSQTIVMTGSQIASAKGPVIKTCAGDPLFITSKGNLVSSNPTVSYSSGYFETKQQRIPELITSVTQYPIISSASSTVHHPATAQKATNTEHRSTGISQNRRGCVNISDASKDSARTAEIKRLEQKPHGKVLTAHGFNEIEPLTVNVIHGKSLRENSVVDMPVLVPIGEPHTPTQRMTTKRSASHSPKDVTSSGGRNSKQIRNNQGNGLSQQNLLTGVTSFDQSGAHLVRDHTKHDLSDNVDAIFNQQLQTTVLSPQPQHSQRKHHQQQQGQQQLHHNQRSSSQIHQQQQSYQMIQQNQMVDTQNQLYHSHQQSVQTETQQTHSKQFHGKRKKSDHEHMTATQQKKMHQEQQMKMHHEQQQQQQQQPKHMQQQFKLQHDQLQQTHHILQQEQEQQLQLNHQLQHEQQMHQEQLQLQFHQELQLQQDQQLQLEQHLQQHPDAGMQGDHQEIVIQQTDDGDNIIGDQLLVQDGNNAFYVDLKNIVTVMSSPEGEIAAVQLANGQTLFVTQSLDGSENQSGLGDQTIQIDGQHLLLTDATALEDGIEVPGQEILVQSLDREVYQDGQLIGNVLQIETSEGIKLVEHPIEYQLINNAKTAATNETNAIMPPIMSALEIPSSKSELVINSKSNESGLIGQNLDDSLAVIGVSTQTSAVRSSLELPITITNPAIAPKTSNPINIGSLYGSGMPQQSQISPTLSSQDPNQLTYELFTASQHNQHTQNIFSDVSGNFKSNDCRTTQIPVSLENHCLNEIILQSGAGTSNRGGGIIQQGNEFIIGSEQVCDQFAVVETQGAGDSNSAYNNPTR